MFVQIEEDRITAFSEKEFAGFTKEFEDIDFDDYCKNPLKYKFDGEAIVINPNYEAEEQEACKIEEIKNIKLQLEELDLKSIRALRSGDAEYIAKYEAQALQLRERLAEIS